MGIVTGRMTTVAADFVADMLRLYQVESGLSIAFGLNIYFIAGGIGLAAVHR